MCGIFGVITSNQSTYSKEFLAKSLKQLALLSETRGKDSSGLCAFNQVNNRIEVIKGPIPIKQLFKEKAIKDIVLSAFSKCDYAKYAFGHARLVTNGTQLNDANNQPVIKDGVIGVHNGIVVNVNELWEHHTSLKRENEIDTELLLSLIRSEIDNNKPIEEAVSSSVNKVNGTVSTAMVFDNLKQFVLATNNGSLYILNNHKDILFFASERYILSKFTEKIKLSQIGSYSIDQIKPNMGLIVDLESFNLKRFSFSESTNIISKISKSIKVQINLTTISSKLNQRSTIVDFDKISYNPNASRERSLLEYPVDRINKLKRCCNCLLPETFPFINFDIRGVCNYCNNYKKKNRTNSFDELLKIVEPYRSKKGGIDVIVPFSGGRDSTYSLHLIKTKLGLNPITYTYDWGLVTDLARRNIARVCGKLGVENIIVAADLHAKRRNVRLNIEAWLRNPKLGMIPIFMAGDKSFHQYLIKLQKQTGIDFNLWGENYLENTDFKTGFNKVPPQFDKKYIYKISIDRQIRLFMSLFSNIVKNPLYINISLYDNFTSFLSRQYYKKHDYYNFFDFYEWNEHEVEQVLFNEYDWERSPDTKTTWRIGDGTASFYNYIYYVVAGFTEHDTFRSNQIREGMIDREKALKLVNEHNTPRYESLKWYLETVGLDFTDVIKRINKIPKLY
jgi:glutamine---fructose-6-phosphate transaminase (isomerizing)